MTITPATTINQVSKTFRSSDTDATLCWLDHGAELARDLRGDKAKHRDVIWQLIVEAVEVIDKTPDQERRWLTSGLRSNWKHPTGMSHAELIALERVRVLSAMKPFDSDQTKYSSRRDDEERAMGVLAWMRWVRAAKSGDRLSKAAVVLARSGDSEIVQKIYCPNRKPNAQNVHEVKIRTAGLIMTGLRDDLGVVRGEGISFR
ncbi:hypothetical protein ABIB80_000254 [Bradyrhizobium sp. i1.15.2]|uniref:hypothetical protein n=1 Tax=Bradyrhizobium sp. i1.15.2 TaxID=3156362 RepID=UPI00339317DA